MGESALRETYSKILEINENLFKKKKYKNVAVDNNRDLHVARPPVSTKTTAIYYLRVFSNLVLVRLGNAVLFQ